MILKKLHGCGNLKRAVYQRTKQKSNRIYAKQPHEEQGRLYIPLVLCSVCKRQTQNNGWCGLDGKTAAKLHIFYLIDSDYRNKGYATQCATALLSYAFDEVRVPFINGGCDKNNIASYRVMEKIRMKHNAFEDNGDPLFFIDSGMYHSKGV